MGVASCRNDRAGVALSPMVGREVGKRRWEGTPPHHRWAVAHRNPRRW